MPAVAEGLPEATIVHRPGEINAWDNKDFVAAVKKTARKKLLIAGISTEVCLAFVSLSARDAGIGRQESGPVPANAHRAIRHLWPARFQQ
jgi:nicotinamidase-related amidase